MEPVLVSVGAADKRRAAELAVKREWGVRRRVYGVMGGEVRTRGRANKWYGVM